MHHSEFLPQIVVAGLSSENEDFLSSITQKIEPYRASTRRMLLNSCSEMLEQSQFCLNRGSGDHELAHQTIFQPIRQRAEFDRDRRYLLSLIMFWLTASLTFDAIEAPFFVPDGNPDRLIYLP